MLNADTPFPLSTMQKAALGALVLHLLLLALIPQIPRWDLPFVEQGFRLNVVLKKEEEQFQQSLNYPTNDIKDEVSQATSLNIASPAPGEDDSQATESQEVTGESSDIVETKAIGQNNTNKISPAVLFGYTSILKFAQLEAVRYTDTNADKLARFSRSFNSRRQYQRRKRTNSYKNQYGDQYVNNGSSNGDICFVKTADKVSTQSGTFDANTYTVHFFRCKDKETGLFKG